jgi:protein-tyrosine phosphatase
MTCPKNNGLNHEWQSKTATQICCIHCDISWSDYAPDTVSTAFETDTSIHAEHAIDCKCTKCDPIIKQHNSDCICKDCVDDELGWTVFCSTCKSNDIEYPVKEGETEDHTVAWCNKCKANFDPFWEMDADVPPINLPGQNKSKPFLLTSGDPNANKPPVATYYTSTVCNHPPTHVINGKTWNIYAGKRYDVDKAANNYDVVLNLTGWSLVSAKEHIIPFQELSKWRKKEKEEHKYKEICLDWPDMGVVDLPKEFWLDLIKVFDKKKSKVLMFCLGGHGRTGTAMAVLMVLGLEYTPEKAVEWVRTNYCKQAIETWKQIDYIYSMVGRKAPPSKERKDFSSSGAHNYNKPDCSLNDTCVCVVCMPDDEYKIHKDSNFTIWPESYKKRKEELKKKKEIVKTIQEKIDKDFDETWLRDGEAEEDYLAMWAGL